MCMNMGHVMGKLKSLDSHILIIKQFHLTTLTALSKTEIKINPARKRLKIVEVCVQCWYNAYMHTIAECTWHTPNDRNDKTRSQRVVFPCRWSRQNVVSLDVASPSGLHWSTGGERPQRGWAKRIWDDEGGWPNISRKWSDNKKLHTQMVFFSFFFEGNSGLGTIYLKPETNKSYLKTDALEDWEFPFGDFLTFRDWYIYLCLCSTFIIKINHVVTCTTIYGSYGYGKKNMEMLGVSYVSNERLFYGSSSCA